MPETPTPEQPAGRQLGDVNAVAEKLDVSARHVYRLAEEGRMPAPLKIGCANRWDLAAIDAWIVGGCKAVRGYRSA